MMSVDTLHELSDPKCTQWLSTVGFAAHKLVPEWLKFAKDNKLEGIYLLWLQMGNGILDINPISNQSGLQQLQLDNPVHLKALMSGLAEAILCPHME